VLDEQRADLVLGCGGAEQRLHVIAMHIGTPSP